MWKIWRKMGREKVWEDEELRKKGSEEYEKVDDEKGIEEYNVVKGKG